MFEADHDAAAFEKAADEDREGQAHETLARRENPPKKMGRGEPRPKFREETPRRRTAGRRATTNAAPHNMSE